jgi:hypothetical protein
VAVGALVLVTSLLVAVRAMRVYSLAFRSAAILEAGDHSHGGIETLDASGHQPAGFSDAPLTAARAD